MSNGKIGSPMRLACFALAAALVLAGCGENAPAGNPLVSDEPIGDASADMTSSAPVIVMLGDSLTAGFQLSAGAALPAALQRELDDRGVPARFVNAGVSGDTTGDGLNRYEWSVEGAKADLLVIALGANDFLGELPPDVPKRNLASILTKAKEDNIPTVLLGVALPGDAKDEREAAYAAIYPQLAAEFSVPYFPNMLAPVVGKPGLLQQDGLHPTAEGVDAMAGEIAGFLTPLVEDLS
jgi:acyl-CoA thioesterase-1